MRVLFMAILLSMLPHPIQAQEGDAAPAQTVGAAAPTHAATRIEVDEQAGVIRFIVDAEERAVLDERGLHVHGDIEFTGTNRDIQTWPERQAADAP